MDDSIELQLQNIILKSQTLLTRLEHDFTDGDIDKNTHSPNFNSKDLESLLNERSELITSFFKRYSKSDVESFSSLLNKMIELDIALIEKSVQLKKHIAIQLIKLKKGNKSVNIYQKAK